MNLDKEMIENNDNKVKKIVVKPVNEGSSLRICIVENEPKFIKAAVEETLKFGEFMLNIFQEKKLLLKLEMRFILLLKLIREIIFTILMQNTILQILDTQRLFILNQGKTN